MYGFELFAFLSNCCRQMIADINSDMKFTGFFTLVLIACHTSSLSAATNTVFPNEQIIETFGWVSAQQKDLAGIEINDTELSSFLKGVSSKHPSQELQQISSDVEILSGQRREKITNARKRDN